MDGKVFRLADKLQVCGIVVQSVSVDVVDTETARDFPARVGFPRNHRAQLPQVRIGDLHERPRRFMAFVPSAMLDASDWELVFRVEAFSESTLLCSHAYTIPDKLTNVKHWIKEPFSVVWGETKGGGTCVEQVRGC